MINDLHIDQVVHFYEQKHRPPVSHTVSHSTFEHGNLQIAKLTAESQRGDVHLNHESYGSQPVNAEC